MQIITISSIKLLPANQECREYRGSLETCQNEHIKLYPHFVPDMAFWIPARQSLFVPMDWKRQEAQS